MTDQAIGSIEALSCSMRHRLSPPVTKASWMQQAMYSALLPMTSDYCYLSRPRLFYVHLGILVTAFITIIYCAGHLGRPILQQYDPPGYQISVNIRDLRG